MKKIFLHLIVLALIIMSGSYTEAQTNKDGEKYAYCMVTGGNGETGWAKFDLYNPTFEILAPKPDGIYFLGGDFGPDGTWYTTEWSGGFYSVDTITGEYTELANLGEILNGFTYSPAHETFFACTGGTLYTLNMSTYTLTEVGPMGNAGSMTGLGSDNRGNLYGIDTSDDKLYVIDPITGISTSIGESGFDFDYNQNCTFSKDTDIMYHAGFWVNPSVSGGLYSYDLTSGAATLDNPFPSNQEVVSFSVPWTMPEHGSIHGLVSDAISGNPVENATITLVPLTGGTNIYEITSTDGQYDFGMVLPGEYEITAVHGNYMTSVVESFTVEVNDELEMNIELENAPYSATINVLYQIDNTPMEGAEVTFLLQTQTTGASGSVTFDNVTSGTFNCTVDLDGYYQGFADIVITDANGEVDVYMYELNNQPRDYVILEEATATWCGPCAALAPTLEQLIEDGLPMAMIAYHGNDAYSNTAGDTRIGYYGINAYPTMVFDGTDQQGSQPYASLESLILEHHAVETPVKIEFGDISIANNKVSGTIHIENMGPINSEDVVLHIALIESHIPEVWQTNDELNHLLRSMTPDEYGTAINVHEVSVKDVEFTISLDEVLDIDNCEIVCFVQDSFTKEIFNGNHFALNSSKIDKLQSGSISVFPIPAIEIINYKTEKILESYKIYNISGQLIKQGQLLGQEGTINISEFKEGSYIIKFTDKDMNLYIERFSK